MKKNKKRTPLLLLSLTSTVLVEMKSHNKRKGIDWQGGVLGVSEVVGCIVTSTKNGSGSCEE